MPSPGDDPRAHDTTPALRGDTWSFPRGVGEVSAAPAVTCV